jgi:hypothetical protein
MRGRIMPRKKQTAPGRNTESVSPNYARLDNHDNRAPTVSVYANGILLGYLIDDGEFWAALRPDRTLIGLFYHERLAADAVFHHPESRRKLRRLREANALRLREANALRRTHKQEEP